ncbi:MAG TPA: hypothetical protein VM347_42230 [Nonomuraea sp.]|nr:hypothetical protein [Nonomuraea sp.]
MITDTRPLVPLKDQIVVAFGQEHWMELGALANALDIVQRHPRLLRSLSFGDPDYAGAVIEVLATIVGRDPTNLQRIEAYVREHFPTGEHISSTAGPSRRLTFSPSVFQVPDCGVDPRRVAVLMPFGVTFGPVYKAIQSACGEVGLICERADDLWENSELVQDIFTMIFRAQVVVADFTDRNPNVFYELGIAHTLGKHVVPITQSKQDVPFDVQHHRYLQYLNNEEGREDLAKRLAPRLRTLAGLSAPSFA